MIILIMTASHIYTHKAVCSAVPAFRRTSYTYLLPKQTVPAATYIFSDFDRLSAWDLERAAHLYRVLKTAGCPVYNDPARALQRLPLLRKLYDTNVNTFQAWPAFDAWRVDRFPVFLRTASAHRGAMTDLISDPAALMTSLETLLAAGFPISDLMVVEYRAEPVRDDVYRKLAMYRIKDQMIPALGVHQRNWAAKYGENGVAGEAIYREELERVSTNPFAETIRRAFEIADIDYGRADFGLVGGRPEVYEINTNPMVHAALSKHPFPSRIETSRLIYERYAAAMSALDHHDRGMPSVIDVPSLQSVRFGKRNAVPDPLWTP